MLREMAFVTSTCVGKSLFLCGENISLACGRCPSQPRSLQPQRARFLRKESPTCAGKGISFPGKLDGSKFRVGIVWTRWNGNLVNAMVEKVKASLIDLKVDSKNIVEMQVPGAFEIPMAARLMSATQKVDAIVCVGVLIKGETDHYEYIASPVAHGLMDLQLTTNIPVIFGVLTCRDYVQAEARSVGNMSEAAAWGSTAVEMALLRASQVGGIVSGKKSVGF